MASSIQAVRDKVQSFNDMDLLVLLGLLVDELKANPGSYPMMREQGAIFRKCLIESGPGTIDLQLERVADDAATCEELSGLLGTVGTRLAEFGPIIAGATLNTRYGVRGVRFSDFETERLYAAIAKIRDLVGVPSGSFRGPRRHRFRR